MTHIRSFYHKEKKYEFVALVDPEDPFRLIVHVTSNGVKVPVIIPGVGFKMVSYSVSFDTECDVQTLLGLSALDWLLDEAERQIKASY